MKIKAVLFDLVGTLIYVKDSVGTVYSIVANGFGYETNPDLLNKSFKEIFNSKESPTGGNEKEKSWWKDLVRDVFKTSGYELGDSFDSIFETIFKEFSASSSWGIYPEVESTFLSLKNLNLKIGLISNFDSRLESLLDNLKIKNHFDLLVYSGKVGFSKPNKKIFLHALNELNLIPEEVIYVGDDLNNDFYPALDLGMNALLIDRHNSIDNSKTIQNLNKILDFCLN